MTETEACHKIDQWLLIPLDYDQVLELLSVIRGSDKFASYVAKVANAEFKSAQDVIRDVEHYEAKQAEKNSALNEKLNEISGGKIQSARYEAEEEDVLDVIAKDKNGGEDDKKSLSSRYSSYVQNQMLNVKKSLNQSISKYLVQSASRQPDTSPGDNSLVQSASRQPDATPGNSITVNCSRCHCAMLVRSESPLTNSGKFMFVVLLIFFFPLSFIPFLYMREEKKYYVCPECGRRRYF